MKAEVPIDDGLYCDEFATGTTSLTYRLTPISAAVVAALGPGGSALAQEYDNAGIDELAIEEIIVTATKRAIPLQDVPQSIEVFSGEAIEKMVMKNMEDYTRAIPSATTWG